MKRVNPFDEIYRQMNFVSAEEKIKNPIEYPRLLEIELARVCNFRCLMCPVGTGVIKRKPGYMTADLYERILDDAAEHNMALRFIQWGEPTLHKDWLKHMKQAKDKGVIVHFNTNGSMLNHENMQSVIDYEIDSVKFSFQGVDAKSYMEMRNKDYFDEMLKKIKLLYSLRGDREKPYIHASTTITYETPEQVESFKKMLEPITDKVSVGRTNFYRFDISSADISEEERERFERLKSAENLVKKRLNCCPEVYDKLSIHYDGKVSACCLDYDEVMVVGDLNRQSLKDIWNSPKLDLYRKELAKGNFGKFELCRSCYDSQETQTPGVQKTTLNTGE
ncbi:radical SAM/SPASM domain-containing protein [Maridesulfovibrio sp.]|uniref:radical SAM/SPASM domain-containing protein n=1 Tax=Maridesulfovibrio sp. TaxID=2795000 RepID=UPI002A18744E|nr:radical SAM/SPASM domain-containing protein [Maridesulfovibrio sp.]